MKWSFMEIPITSRYNLRFYKKTWIRNKSLRPIHEYMFCKKKNVVTSDDEPLKSVVFNEPWASNYSTLF